MKMKNCMKSWSCRTQWNTRPHRAWNMKHWALSYPSYGRVAKRNTNQMKMLNLQRPLFQPYDFLIHFHSGECFAFTGISGITQHTYNNIRLPKFKTSSVVICFRNSSLFYFFLVFGSCGRISYLVLKKNLKKIKRLTTYIQVPSCTWSWKSSKCQAYENNIIFFFSPRVLYLTPVQVAPPFFPVPIFGTTSFQFLILTPSKMNGFK